MDKIKGTNLGNWLVLEKWMSPGIFEGTGAEDEIWLGRKLPADVLAAKLKEHRDAYVAEEDFAFIAEQGINLVRIPVPYFIFGDRPPYISFRKKLIEKVQKHTPVIVGEWCICNRYAEKQPKPVMLAEDADAVRRERYQEMAAMQLNA